MDIDLIVAFAALATLIATGVGVVVGMQNVKNQLWLQTFTEYTKRYSEIMDILPFEARRPDSGFDISALDAEQRKRALGAFRKYFNLCSEELWLKNLGRIDERTWSVWEVGIKEVARFPSFAYAWTELRCEYEYYPVICSFMDGLAPKVEEPPA